MFMKKFKFYKNNIRQEIPVSDKLTFLENELKLIKENNETKLVLDIGKNECIYSLKKEEITINIPVIKMDYIVGVNVHIISYQLASEPNVENLIKIDKNGA